MSTPRPPDSDSDSAVVEGPSPYSIRTWTVQTTALDLAGARHIVAETDYRVEANAALKCPRWLARLLYVLGISIRLEVTITSSAPSEVV